MVAERPPPVDTLFDLQADTCFVGRLPGPARDRTRRVEKAVRAPIGPSSGRRPSWRNGSQVQGVVLMDSNYTYIADLAKQVDIPADGILSRTLYSDDHVKVVLFGFDAGQELSEHTASMPAILHIVQGEALLTLGDDSVEAPTGAWVHMRPQLQHSVYARTPLVMLLLLIKQVAERGRDDASD
jgi:quercetin dioxygenase-like cupin family protein